MSRDMLEGFFLLLVVFLHLFGTQSLLTCHGSPDVSVLRLLLQMNYSVHHSSPASATPTESAAGPRPEALRGQDISSGPWRRWLSSWSSSRVKALCCSSAQPGLSTVPFVLISFLGIQDAESAQTQSRPRSYLQPQHREPGSLSRSVNSEDCFTTGFTHFPRFTGLMLWVVLGSVKQRLQQHNSAWVHSPNGFFTSIFHFAATGNVFGLCFRAGYLADWIWDLWSAGQLWRLN